MLDKLIESKNKSDENRRLGGFLLTTSTGAFSVAVFALIYSLFSYNLALGSDNLNLMTLVAPPPMAANEPPVERAAPPKQSPSVEQTISKLPTRRANVQRIDENPVAVPKEVSVTQNQQPSRPNSPFLVDRTDTNPSDTGLGRNQRSGSPAGTGIANTFEPPPEFVKNAVEPPPALKIKPKAETAVVPPEKKIVSTGVVNGKATTLVKPVYSPAAQAIRASGEVKVQVTIDEDGRVISANAISGHPLLTQSALSAARQSRFSPTYLSGQKVKVSGIIVYNFKV